MSKRFRYTGSTPEILSAGGVEIELIPGQIVELSSEIQANEYCIQLINRGLLVEVVEPPAPTPTPTPPAPTPTPPAPTPTPTPPAPTPTPTPPAPTPTPPAPTPEDDRLFPIAGYPLYQNMGPKDWVMLEPSNSDTPQFYVFIGEKAHKRVYIVQYEADLKEAREDWSEQHPGLPYPEDFVSLKIAQFKACDSSGCPLPRWIIPNKRIKMADLDFSTACFRADRRESEEFREGYPFFWRLSDGSYYSSEIQEPTSDRPDSYIFKTGSQKQNVREIKIVTWLEHLRMGMRAIRDAAMIRGAVPEYPPELDCVKRLKQIIIDNFGE